MGLRYNFAVGKKAEKMALDMIQKYGIIMLDNDGWTASANAMCTCIIVIVFVMLGILHLVNKWVSKTSGREVMIES